MRELLESEGVRVEEDRVEVQRYLWIPPIQP